MLGDLSHVEKIYIRCGYTDMRKQLNGLLDIIQYNFKLDPYSNSLFLFCGRGLTGSKQSITRETVSAFYTNGTKTERLQWPRTGEEAKQILISSCAGFWKVEPGAAKGGSEMAPA